MYGGIQCQYTTVRLSQWYISVDLLTPCYKVSSFVHNVWSLSRRQCTHKQNGMRIKQQVDQVFNQTQSLNQINWSPNHQTPNCDDSTFHEEVTRYMTAENAPSCQLRSTDPLGSVRTVKMEQKHLYSTLLWNTSGYFKNSFLLDPPYKLPCEIQLSLHGTTPVA